MIVEVKTAEGVPADKTGETEVEVAAEEAGEAKEVNAMEETRDTEVEVEIETKILKEEDGKTTFSFPLPTILSETSP